MLFGPLTTTSISFIAEVHLIIASIHLTSIFLGPKDRQTIKPNHPKELNSGQKYAVQENWLFSYECIGQNWPVAKGAFLVSEVGKTQQKVKEMVQNCDCNRSTSVPVQGLEEVRSILESQFVCLTAIWMLTAQICFVSFAVCS